MTYLCIRADSFVVAVVSVVVVVVIQRQFVKSSQRFTKNVMGSGGRTGRRSGSLCISINTQRPNKLA